jgi:hypothetical protein
MCVFLNIEIVSSNQSSWPYSLRYNKQKSKTHRCHAGLDPVSRA